MRRLKTHDGQTCNLSDKVYEIVRITNPMLKGNPWYQPGTRVRLVAFAQPQSWKPYDQVRKPGWHIDNDHYTVCRANAAVAEFVGIPKADLKEVG